MLKENYKDIKSDLIFLRDTLISFLNVKAYEFNQRTFEDYEIACIEMDFFDYLDEMEWIHELSINNLKITC